MSNILLGPLLRYVGATDATVWVETDSPCEVEVLNHRSHTFHVEGHHYAIVHIAGLDCGRAQPYTVALDGVPAYPEPGSEFPPCVIHTIDPQAPLKLVFGSCRVTVPHEPPFTLTKAEDSRGRETDALYAFARRLVASPPDSFPHTLLLLGDQIYADEVSPNTRDFIRARRNTNQPPGADGVADFEEYTHLYREAWGDPLLRWLLSTVSTLMIYDDHDVRDDWNTSAAWVEEMRALPWWNTRIVGGFMSYWIYQHLGNLLPEELRESELLRRVREAADAGPILREFAFRADRQTEGTRWSYYRDLGNTRLVVIDARAGRVLKEGHRSIVDDKEWSWIEQHATGGFDHLLLASSVPVLLAPAMHHLEAWNEKVCGGAWGTAAAKIGEKIRQAIDLEHWAAFENSFHKFVELLRAVRAGERGRTPATVVALSGDVHHAYLAKVAFKNNGRDENHVDGSRHGSVYQAVCSPIRNPLSENERRALRAGWSNPAAFISRRLSRSVGVREPEIGWELVHDEPWFDNQIATLELRGRVAHLCIEKSASDATNDARLATIFEHQLS
ncbi:MAG: alkaline phosphatase family protein [Acidobacteriota bacterium]|nr:alkaline phosphatase family protein [Acidobacteriota bacterium]